MRPTPSPVLSHLYGWCGACVMVVCVCDGVLAPLPRLVLNRHKKSSCFSQYWDYRHVPSMVLPCILLYMPVNLGRFQENQNMCKPPFSLPVFLFLF